MNNLFQISSNVQLVREPEMVRQCNIAVYCIELHYFGHGETKYPTIMFRKVLPVDSELRVHSCICS